MISRSGKRSMQDVEREASSCGVVASNTPRLSEPDQAACTTTSVRLNSTTMTAANDAIVNANTTTNNYYGASRGPSDLPLDPMKPLTDRVVWAAMHDSDERSEPPRCHPETRTALLDSIDQWATGHSERPILWLNGPVGAGKSAIAQTLAERWKKQGILGATFFMRRTAAGQNSREHLVPTLVHQLCMQDTRVHAHVKSAMISDPNILERSLEVQLNQLVADAFVDPDPARSGQTVARVLIIDGLDECCIPYKSQTFEEQQRQVLNSLASVFQRNLCLRFLIASRPESQIRQSFSYGPLANLTETISLTPAQGDVELYLRCKFVEIRAIHPAADPSWPTKSDIDKLVTNSSGHFVYPATVVRHLLSVRNGPEAALGMILNQTVHPRDGQDWPLAQLDALYHHILHTSVRSIDTNAFSTLHLLTQPRSLMFHDFSIDKIANYLLINSSQLYADLVDLHSVLHVPQDSFAILTFHHASFSEYLTDSGRSGLFCVRYPFSLQLQLKLLKYAQRILTMNPGGCSAVIFSVSGDLTGNYNVNSVNNAVKCLVSTILMANPNEIMGDLSLRRFWYITQRNAKMMLALPIVWPPVLYSATKGGTRNRIDPEALVEFLGSVFVIIWTILTQLRILLFFHIPSLLLQYILSQAALVKKAVPGSASYIELIMQLLSSFTFSTMKKYVFFVDLFVFGTFHALILYWALRTFVAPRIW